MVDKTQTEVEEGTTTEARRETGEETRTESETGDNRDAPAPELEEKPIMEAEMRLLDKEDNDALSCQEVLFPDYVSDGFITVVSRKTKRKFELEKKKHSKTGQT